MAKTKEQLESEINGTNYFSIKGDNTEALRKTELYKLSALVFEYCKRFVYVKSEKGSQYGMEIYNCTVNCLNNFKPEMETPFLNYLNAALSRTIKTTEQREKNTVNKLWQDPVQTKNGKESSLIDTQGSSMLNPEEEAVKEGEILTALEVIENEFVNKQERVKPYLRKLLTREYFDCIVCFLGEYSFVDKEMVKNVYFSKKESLPSQKEIADAFGKLEADASRTINNFKREVKEKLEEKC
jgi:hypothetical protein